MNNKTKKRLFIFCFSFFLLTLISIFHSVDLDQVWTYGFSYNISRGLIPYRDFNMIIGPLYSLFFSLPIYLFGNYLIVFKLFHVLIYSLIFVLVYEKIGYKYLFIIALLAIKFSFCTYNAFCAMLTILILILLDSNYKYKNIFIGLLIGIIIMTKHNIGLALFVVYFFTTNKKNIIYVFIPIVFSMIYLLCNNALLQYIDFCFLGMGGFIGNFKTDILALIFVIFLFIYYIKKYIRLKDIKILYILAFLIIVFPLIESIHLLFGLIPIAYYILKEESNLLIYRFVVLFIIIGIIFSTFLVYNKELIMDKNFLKYNSIKKGTNESFKKYLNYLKKIDGNIYLLMDSAYCLKLYNNETTSFYDLINKGNLGSDENKYIKMMEEKCKKEKCTFILDRRYFENSKKDGWQMSKTFKDFVVKNYKYVETIPSGDRLYTNKKN